MKIFWIFPSLIAIIFIISSLAWSALVFIPATQTAYASLKKFTHPPSDTGKNEDHNLTRSSLNQFFIDTKPWTTSMIRNASIMNAISVGSVWMPILSQEIYASAQTSMKIINNIKTSEELLKVFEDFEYLNQPFDEINLTDNGRKKLSETMTTLVTMKATVENLKRPILKLDSRFSHFSLISYIYFDDINNRMLKFEHLLDNVVGLSLDSLKTLIALSNLLDGAIELQLTSHENKLLLPQSDDLEIYKSDWRDAKTQIVVTKKSLDMVMNSMQSQNMENISVYKDLETFSNSIDSILLLMSAGEDLIETGQMASQNTNRYIHASHPLKDFSIHLNLFNNFVEERSRVEKARNKTLEAELILKNILLKSDSEPIKKMLKPLSKNVSDFSNSLGFFHNLLELGSKSFESEIPLHYLLMGHSSDELRATGGFVSALWLVTIDEHKGIKFDYYDIVEIDNLDRLSEYPDAPKGLQNHMNAWVWFMRDVSWDPDFPTTAANAVKLFKIGTDIDVDGVIGINQWVLVDIVEQIGPSIYSENGKEITDLSILEYIESETDAHGTNFTEVIFDQLRNKIHQDLSIGTLISIGESLQNSLTKKEIAFYFTNPEPQKVASEKGWDGAILNDNVDYVHVIDSNVGWNKVDRNIERSFFYQADLSDLSNMRAKLELDYKNHSSKGATDCEPQWKPQGYYYHELKNSCYWNYFRVFVPLGSDISGSTYMTLPRESIYAKLGRGIAGQDTLEISNLHNKILISALTTVAAGESNKIVLEYSLPGEIIEIGNDHLKYQLRIPKQPGVLKKNGHVEIIYPQGYQIGNTNLPYYQVLENGKMIYKFTMENDIFIEINFNHENKSRN